MKRLQLFSFAAFFLIGLACKRQQPNPCPTLSKLVSMHIKWQDSVINYQFYYDDSSYVTKIVESDSVNGHWYGQDSIIYQYTANHNLTQAYGLTGIPLNYYTVKYTYTGGFISEDFYDNTNYRKTNCEFQYFSDTVISYGFTIYPIVPIAYYVYYILNKDKNIIVDSNYISTTPSYNKTYYSAYDNKHNYAQLIKGIINPSIDNIFFPFFSANNVTAQKVITFDANYPHIDSTTSYTNISYEYNCEDYPIQAIRTNSGTGVITTTTFTYQ